MDVVPGEKYTHPSPTPSGHTKLYCQQGIEVNERLVRLEIDPADLYQDRQMLWPTGSGPVCVQTHNQCQRYYSWQPDPIAEAVDAFLQDWSVEKGFANPPWNLIPQVLNQAQTQGQT